MGPKLRGQRAEDQQRLDKLRAANAALRGELGAASRLAERRARDGAGRVKAAALVAAHARRLAAVQCYYRPGAGSPPRVPRVGGRER